MLTRPSSGAWRAPRPDNFATLRQADEPPDYHGFPTVVQFPFDYDVLAT